MSSDIVMRAADLGKSYHIYKTPRDRLKQSFWRGRKRYYQEFWALQGVYFEVRRGETVGVIGRNGSGKSTLLQILAGTLTPTVGEVEASGRIGALLELGAGFNPEFTRRENVYLNASILGLSREEIDSKFDDIVAFADIGDYMDQPVKTYSSGMYLRLAFAVVAHVDADILVIDEALAVGDVFFTQKCMRFLRAFRETGAIFFVSHDSAAVVNLCHKVMWLDRGRLSMSGSPKDVCEAYLSGLSEEQGRSSFSSVSTKVSETHLEVESPRGRKPKNQRLDFAHQSPCRNEIEVSDFDPDLPSFGKGGTKIVAVRILSEDGAPLSRIVGGELVCLAVRARTSRNLTSPIIGFLFKDRLGQTLFADNTYRTYSHHPLEIKAGQLVDARLLFEMPILPSGHYSIATAIAEGTQFDHVQHHSVHDALILKYHTSRMIHGLVGIPMLDISLRVRDENGVFT